MATSYRRFLQFTIALFFFCANFAAHADSWIQPTPEELKMTAEAAAPGAVAVYLFRDEQADDKLHMHSLYVRLKVLTEKGKDYADVELAYAGHFNIRAIEGRTIHSDGTVIPFTGKPYEKLLEKTSTQKYKAKVFTLPDVQVGSILEYRYVLEYDDDRVLAPMWYIQEPLYVRKAHYQFIPYPHMVNDGHGGVTEGQVAYYANLPKGAEVQYAVSQNSYALNVEKVEPTPEDEYMPPMQSLSYRVLFYYTAMKNAEEYWKQEGKYWSRDTDKFMSANKLGGIASQLVAPADTPRQKVQKIYDAVMKIENTSFTRGHSGAEDKAQGVKIKTAEDVWNLKRGDSDEIAILFVGLVRAAGLKAYVSSVTDRDRAFFVMSYLSLGQLDDDIAIVELDGKEEYFDPGERYCAFGTLHWKHTMTQGLRQTDHGAELGQTPSPGYKSTTVFRNAELDLAADGKVHGTIRIIMTGAQSLAWRQRALSTDEEAIKKEFEQEIQRQVPAGVEIKANHIIALTDYDKTLMVVLDVTGSMGTATSKRVFLPATFFEASSKPMFVHDKRTIPIDLDYPYATQDSVNIHLPESFTVESMPKDAEIPLPKNAIYQVTFKQEPGKLHSGRLFILANSVYPTEEYSSLKDFYQKVNAKDQEQAILQLAPAHPAASGAQ